jgi:hypothetical protein
MAPQFHQEWSHMVLSVDFAGTVASRMLHEDAMVRLMLSPAGLHRWSIHTLKRRQYTSK